MQGWYPPPYPAPYAQPPYYPPPYAPPPAWQCPFCRSYARPVELSKVSTGGWVLFAVLLLLCFPLFWVGLLVKEHYRACGCCGQSLGNVA